MIRYFLLITSLVVHSVSAQLRLAATTPTLSDKTEFIEISDTLQLPFWDDFSSSNALDTTKWQFGFDVYINNTQSIQHPTVNVATFDGINFLGQPHNGQTQFNGLGDSLVSQPINLSNLEEDELETVYLSFYWQLKGNGDLPNTDDSLRLSFYRQDSIWVPQDINPDFESESLTGGLNNLSFDDDSIQQFQQIILPVRGDFLHAGFRLKFESFTSLNGTYDSWHIDYIYLNKNRSNRDTLHFDRSVSSRNSSLFQPYLSFPMEQFEANLASTISFETITLNNLDNTPHPARFSYQINNLTSGESGPIQFITPNDLMPLEIGRQEQVTQVQLPQISGDSVVLETIIHYITGDKFLFEELDQNGDTLFLPQDLTVNDTLKSTYLLHNYLAYDDGSSEFAAGINLNQGELAVQFILNNPDTLTDIDIHFPAISPTSTGEALTLKVWGDLDNTALLREFGGVIEAKGRNEFQRFTLNNPIIVRDTFYIGFEQFTDNYVGVGFDRNNIGGFNKIYTNTNREWVQNNRLEGSLLLRPVFRNETDFILSNPNQETDLSFYPNPATETIHFTELVEQVVIYNLNGSIMKSNTNCSSLTISDLQSGIYLVLLSQKGNQTSRRLVIR